jgi:hypothetical protein
MSIRNFLTSKTLLKHLLLAAVVSLVAVYLVLTSLKLYSRHGEVIEVPNLYGLTESEFIRILDRLDLKYEIADSAYVEEVVAGGVIDQVPDAGHKVKSNRTLFLTLNAIAPEQVALPRLTDISLRQSLSQLETVGLIPGDIIYKPSEFRNLVLEARVGGREVFTGEMIAKGTRVDLTVGSGDGSEMVSLPDLTGLTLGTARAILSESMLTTGAIIYDNTVISRYDSLNAVIWRQHPNIRQLSNIPAGSSVDIWVTTDQNLLNRPSGEEDTELPGEDEF